MLELYGAKGWVVVDFVPGDVQGHDGSSIACSASNGVISANSSVIPATLLTSEQNDDGELSVDELPANRDATVPCLEGGLRLETYLRVMEETGRSEFTCVVRSEEGESYANDVVRELLRSEEHPTVIFGGHDERAIGALHAIQELDLDISVVGYGNVPIASHPALSLTSVDQQGERMGGRAVELSLERINGRTDALHERFTSTLHVRKSSRRQSTG